MKMKFMRCGLVLLSSIFLIISFFIISWGASLKILFGDHYHVLHYGSWYTTTPQSLSSLYIATGCLLLAVSIFGIVAVLKQSTCMTNVYGVFLSLISLLQLAAAITGFILAAQSEYIWTDVLSHLVSGYLWGDGSDALTLDWIQRTFRCCGDSGPEDWKHQSGFTPFDKKVVGYGSLSHKSLLRVPQSCCLYEDEWDPQYKVCRSVFEIGCNEPLGLVLTESVMLIASSALIMGFLQIFGIVYAFLYARTIRQNKTSQDLQRWTLISQSMGLEKPTSSNDLLPGAEPHVQA